MRTTQCKKTLYCRYPSGSRTPTQEARAFPIRLLLPIFKPTDNLDKIMYVYMFIAVKNQEMNRIFLVRFILHKTTYIYNTAERQQNLCTVTIVVAVYSQGLHNRKDLDIDYETTFVGIFFCKKCPIFFYKKLLLYLKH